MSVNVRFDVIFILYYRQYLWTKVQFYLISPGLYIKLCELLLPVQNMHMPHIIWKTSITVKKLKMTVTWHVHYMWWCFIFISPSSMSSTEIYRISRVVNCRLFSFLNLIITHNFLKTFHTLTTSHKTVWQDIARFCSKIIQGYSGLIRVKLKPDKTLWVWIRLKKEQLTWWIDTNTENWVRFQYLRWAFWIIEVLQNVHLISIDNTSHEILAQCMKYAWLPGIHIPVH